MKQNDKKFKGMGGEGRCVRASESGGMAGEKRARRK